MPGPTPVADRRPVLRVRPAVRGRRAARRGRTACGSPAPVYDGAGDPVADALVEIWQANRHGRYRHPEDTRDELPLEDGLRRASAAARTDESGEFRFYTVKPGATSPHAPHINVIVHARGLLRHLFTRIYFPEEAANAADPLLSSIEDPAMRETLIAHDLRFDIHLQGERQTAFFDTSSASSRRSSCPRPCRTRSSGDAWVRAMLDVEAALAAAQAAAGVIPAEAAEADRGGAARLGRPRDRGARRGQPGRAAGRGAARRRRRVGPPRRDEPGHPRQRGDAGRAARARRRCSASWTRSSAACAAAGARAPRTR